MWHCLMDSELIKFTQEIEARHHQSDIMAECVRVCGFTHTHANALSSKHKFVSNHTIVSVLHERIRGEQQAPVGLSIWVCMFLCFGLFLDCSLSRPLLLFLNIGPVSSLLISVSFFLSLHFSVCLQTYSTSLCTPILWYVCGVWMWGREDTRGKIKE